MAKVSGGTKTYSPKRAMMTNNSSTFFENKWGVSHDTINNLNRGISNALLDIGEDLRSASFNWDSNSFKVKTPGVELKRRFFTREDGSIEVHHTYFTIERFLQGKGTSKKIIRASYDLYKKMGVRYISVFADINIGGYTWAKYGFRAPFEEIEGMIKKAEGYASLGIFTQKQYGEIRNIGRNYVEKNGVTERFPMKIFTGKEWSKTLLKRTGWDGLIDLHDPTQRREFEQYIGYKK